MPEVPENPLDPFVGRTFGDYEVLARVGGGSMGVVYKGRHLRLHSARALKFLPPQWSHDEDAKLRFRREAEAASATDHPNICTIHDICETPDGQLFIVMAFCEGVTLKARLAEGPVPVAEALDIATQMASGLGNAHLQGIVHRDVKPGNVMLTENGVRLVDFGLATFTDALQLTTAGTPIGTMAYMSPEQVRGGRADARSDVWAVGVVLYQMLTGRLPFGSARGETVAYAICHDVAEPIRAARPEVPEGVEQLVFRAMHKDPAVRYANGREFARALRAVRGLDDRTDLVTVPAQTSLHRARGASRVSSRLRAVAALSALMAASAVAWALLWPATRVRVVVAPFSNHTGDTELDRYRLALTQAAILALRNSSVVAAEPYSHVLESLGGLPGAGQDVSSRDTLDTVMERSKGAAVLVPTLLREGGAWRVRLEQRAVAIGTMDWTFESDPVVSSLSLDTAYQLALGLAEPIEDRFISRRADLARRVLSAFGLGAKRPPSFARSLEAALAFEEGTRHFEDLEFAEAHRAFRLAASNDPRNPVLLAWMSRVAQILRIENEATEAADLAVASLSPEVSPTDRAFVEAVAAEARRDGALAEQRYRERVEARDGDYETSMDLAAFLDRQGRQADAVQLYHDVLARHAVRVRPSLELCRLKGPSWLNEPTEARKHGETALAAYRTVRGRGGEGQSLLCLVDTLRVGTPEERQTAEGYVNEARAIFESLGFDYNLARVDYYAGLVAGMSGRITESAELNERALRRAESSGNAPLEPLILTNLGVAHVELGNRSMAVDFYQRAYTIYQAWREEARAARVQANRGALLVEYGNPEEGYRDVRNALAVFQKLGDRNFEVFCLRVLGTYYRNQGRHQEALSELNKGLAIARERGLAENIALITMRIGLSEFELGRYAAAVERFLEALSGGEGRQSPEARVRLARTYLRLGDRAVAAAELDRAEAQMSESGQSGGSPLLWLVRGEWAAESGHPGEARALLERGAALWIDASSDPAAVEARGRLGLMDALDGRSRDGARMIAASLEAARQMGHFALQARCRLWLAQLALAGGRFDEASGLLDAIPPDDDEQTIGPELRAEAHHWRSRLLDERGDPARARSEAVAAGQMIQRVSDALPEAARQAFRARPSVLALSR